jgi:putative ABC transport system permease protein
VDGAKVWHFKVLEVVPDVPLHPGGFSVGNYRYLQKSRILEDQSKPPFFLELVKNTADGDAAANAIDTLFANSPIPTLSQSDYSGQQTQAEGAVNVAAITRRVSAVGLFMILLLTGHGIAQSVRERLPEFAMLKTLGFSDAGVIAMVMTEALLPCLIGAGLGLGIAASFADELPKLLPDLGLPKPYLSPMVILEAIAAATLVALIGAALPVRRLKRLDVAAVLSGR